VGQRHVHVVPTDQGVRTNSILWSAKAPSISSTPMRVKSVVHHLHRRLTACRHPEVSAPLFAMVGQPGVESRLRFFQQDQICWEPRSESRPRVSIHAHCIKGGRDCQHDTLLSDRGSRKLMCQAATRCAKYRRDTSTGETLGTSLGAPQGRSADADPRGYKHSHDFCSDGAHGYGRRLLARQLADGILSTLVPWRS